VKAIPSFSALAARRLTWKTQGYVESRAAPVRRALLDALVRLDQREARRQSDLLQAMGAGSTGPLSEAEMEAVIAKLSRLIAEAKARAEASR
jgi:hypothetical protein